MLLYGLRFANAGTGERDGRNTFRRDAPALVREMELRIRRLLVERLRSRVRLLRQRHATDPPRHLQRAPTPAILNVTVHARRALIDGVPAAGRVLVRPFGLGHEHPHEAGRRAAVGLPLSLITHVPHRLLVES